MPGAGSPLLPTDGTLALGEVAQDAELVALRVGQDDPPGAGPVLPAQVGHLDGAVREQARQSSSRVPSTGSRSRWMRFFPALASGTSMKSNRWEPSRADDHALLVARQVRVVLDVAVVEDPLPPLREGVGVAAVDGRVGHPCGHGFTLSDRSARGHPLGR